MEISKDDSGLDPKLSWLERADRVGQVWGSSPHGPTIPLPPVMAFVYILQGKTTGRFYVGSYSTL